MAAPKYPRGGRYRVKLTDEIERQILASIRAGGFPHVAAQAWGVPLHIWNLWKEWGTKENQPVKKYKDFFNKVCQAEAQARLKAEMAAMQDDPRFWLKNGPGKEGDGNPGWTAVVRPMIKNNNQTINLFTSPDFLKFMAIMRQVLAPYPEALQAMSVALDGGVQPPIQIPPPPETIIVVPDPSMN